MWDIGLAENNSARSFEPSDRSRVLGWRPVPEIRYSPGGGQPSDVKGFFDCNRNAEQRLPRTTRQGGICGLSGTAGSLEVTNNDRIEAWIERVDARDDMLSELDCRNLSGLQCFNKFFGRAVLPLRSRHRNRLLSKSSAGPCILRDGTSDRYRAGRNQKLAPASTFHDSALPQLFCAGTCKFGQRPVWIQRQLRMTPLDDP